jgi:two-component system response regulator HupR/HoxA
MNMARSESNLPVLLQPRELRRPLFVPVATNPPLLQGWSENISSKGIGVIGRVPPNAETPSGTILLSFQLPDLSHVEAAGVVAWSRRIDKDAVALGIAFTNLPPLVAQQLSRFVAEFRFRVVVVGADAAMRARMDEAAADLVSLEYVDTEADVPPFDVAGVVSCGALPALPTSRNAREHVDFAPRCIAIIDASDTALVESFRSGRLAAALSPDADAATLRSAVFDVCREWSIRSELRTTTVRFARELYARRTSGANTAQPMSSTAAVRASYAASSASALEVRDARDVGEGIVAESDSMRAVLAQLRMVAPRKVVVLLEGETGSGKEVFAKELHARSDRAQRPLVVQDCGTLTETLLDSELFGHVRGAFTGANADHPGLFVVADGGTMFLDEIENTTPAFQAKLLRVIETGQIRPVGGSRTRVVDVRVIAATNANLRTAVEQGKFRADLYYRLSAFPLAIPPLRDRGDDVVLLATRLAHDASRTHALPMPTLSAEVLAAVRRFRWPGNVRQLKNAMERAVLLSTDGHVEVEHLPDDVRAAAARIPEGSLAERVEAFERGEIERALRDAGGVITRAAHMLQANRITLARRMKQLGVAPG